jgi:gluconokinase
MESPIMTVDRIILALDIGSSSVRCTAYRMVEKQQQQQQQQHPPATSETTGENESKLSKTTIITVESIPGCSSSSRILQSVQPNSGYINLRPEQQQQQQQPNYNEIHSKNSTTTSNEGKADASLSLLDEIDSCIDDQLKRLEEVMISSPIAVTTTTTTEEQADPSTDPPPPPSYQIVGIGISTFVMNLVGVDSEGNLVGPMASCSYACNAPAVALECRSLRQTLGVAHLERLHQQTGAPLHSAFALPQLRVLYHNNGSPPNGMINRVHQWQTIASLCLARWTGKLQAAAAAAMSAATTPSSPSSPSSCGSSFGPISYSEASWTGLLNIRTCTWDEDALALLPVECQRALPPLADCTDDMVHPGGIPEYMPSSSSSVESDTENTSTPSRTRTKNPYWDRWPALRGAKENQGDVNDNNKDKKETYCRLFLGLGDGACANIGSHCCTPNRIAVTIGTSAAARVIFPLERQPSGRASEEAVQENKEADTAATPPQQEFLESPLSSPSLQMLPPGLFCYRIDQSHVLLGGALTDGGSMVEWCRSLLNLSTPESFSECMTTVETLLESDYALSAVAAATHGGSKSTNNTNKSLTVIPFLSGERATGWRDGATGALVGITRETTPAHVLKASMEAVVLRLQAVLQRIQEGMTQMTAMTTTTTTSFSTAFANDNTNRPSPPLRIIASGTALERNKLWRQMLADCSGLQVCHLTEIEEATSRGAAHMVANALAMEKDGRQQTPQDTSEDASVVATVDARRPLLQEEEILSSTMTVSEPRAFTQPYWKSVTGAQETLITTISPLWK